MAGRDEGQQVVFKCRKCRLGQSDFLFDGVLVAFADASLVASLPKADTIACNSESLCAQ